MTRSSYFFVGSLVYFGFTKTCEGLFLPLLVWRTVWVLIRCRVVELLTLGLLFGLFLWRIGEGEVFGLSAYCRPLECTFRVSTLRGILLVWLPLSVTFPLVGEEYSNWWALSPPLVTSLGNMWGSWFSSILSIPDLSFLIPAILTPVNAPPKF